MTNSHHQAVFEGLLRCPNSAEKIHLQDGEAVSESGRYRYPITASGIPLFMGAYWTKEALQQQKHYDRIAEEYTDNLTYPHTQTYFKALDDALLEIIEGDHLHIMAEICCGHGESYVLFEQRFDFAVGVDVSQAMLEAGRASIQDTSFQFIQGDATCLPIDDETVDTVLMLGGIHHVNDRHRLFSEVHRILKPGGRFYWREPVSDLFLWRWLRFIVYKLSPTLDFETERPLQYTETKAQLESAGFVLEAWKTHGLIGFMLFMNSDVLFFNRAFRYIPGIVPITRFFVRLDRWLINLPGMKKNGLQVVGRAVKPARE